MHAAVPKALFLVSRPDHRAGIHDDRDEVDEPEVEHDDANNEEETPNEELRVYHGVHDGRPLQPGNSYSLIFSIRIATT